MGTTAQKLQAVANSKAAIKAAIEAKGVANVGNKLSDYAGKITDIPVDQEDLRYGTDAQGASTKKSFTIDFLDDLVSIGNYGMMYAYYRSGVTAASFPNLTSIGQNGMAGMFQNCASLTTVEMPKLSNIGNNGLNQMFSGCTSLETVDFSQATAIPSLYSTNTFNNTNVSYKVIVPNALYDNWCAASNWSDSSIVGHIVKAEQGLKFTAAQAGSTITLNAVGTPPSISLMYSTDDGKTFNAYTVGTTITLANIGDTVRFKAGSGGNTAFASSNNDYHQFVMTGNISYSSPMESLWWLLDPMGIAPSSFAQKAFLKLFKNCEVLHGGFDFSIFTTIPIDALRETFNKCSNITGLDLSSLTSVENSGLNQAFYQCPSLTSVDLSSLTSVDYEGLRSAFQGCTALTSVDLSSLTSVGSLGMGNAFQGCTSLTNVYLTKLSSVGNNGINSAFNGCTHLELVDFSQATAVPAMSNINTFSNTNNTFKIVVPDALYNDWIVATNWSTYASQIVKVSDYTPAS